MSDFILAALITNKRWSVSNSLYMIIINVIYFKGNSSM